MTDVPTTATDLVLDRTIAVPRRKVWEAWTQPEQLRQWFTPAPYEVSACDIDLRPGGTFRFVNRSPEGDSMEFVFCYLEVVAEERLVWTNLLGPGYRPHPMPDLAFTAVLSLTDAGAGTHYQVTAMHPTPERAAFHAELGFAEGWGAALDQLVALMSR